MAYTNEVVRRAEQELERRRTARQAQQRVLRSEIYERLPEAQKIERQLQTGMLALAMSALSHESDPSEQVKTIREQNRALQTRRAELLTQNGYEADCLSDKPACSKCDDRGWVGSAMCDCLKELCAVEQIRSLSSLLDLGEQSFETFSLDWYSTEYSDQLGMSPRENMVLVERVCRNYAERFGKFMIHNLFLTGDPGLGKTFLSACIARVVSDRGFSVVYDTASSIFGSFEDAKFGRGTDPAEAVRRYLGCDLLILDDLGSEMTSALTQADLYTIINTRLMEDRHTVISSNLSLEDVRRRYQPMIASRLEGEYRELSFVGKDIRIQRRDC